MSIFYAVVARGDSVLAEFTPRSGNFPTVTRMVLQKIDPTSDTKTSYLYENQATQYMFHCLVRDGITYMCLTDDKSKRRTPFLFLEDVAEQFMRDFGARAHTAVAFSLNRSFGRTLEDRMQFYNNNPNADPYGRVRDQLSDLKGIMVENIDKVLQRGEKIELLVDKTELLNQSAQRFQRSAKTLKNVMWWKNVKMWILIAVIVAILIWLIASFICGFDFSKCRKS